MKKIIFSFFDYVIISLWLYSMLFIPSFLFIHVVSLFIQGTSYLNSVVVKIPIFDSLIVLILLLPSLGSVLSIIRGKIAPIQFWQLSLEKMLIEISAAFLTTYIIWKIFLVFFEWQYVGFSIVFIIALFLIPQIPSFMNSVDFTTFKEKLVDQSRHSKSPFISLGKIIFLIVILACIHSLVLSTSNAVYSFSHSQEELSRYPIIKKIEPGIVYYGTKVIIWGDKFGWRKTDKPKLFNQYGEVINPKWTDSKIIFAVPLHWKLGTVRFWIERPFNINGKKTMVKSNVVEIKLISRLDHWNADDDAYFQQFDHLDKETKRLNGRPY